MPKVSIILATHNGARTLPKTLSALEDICKSSIDLELILVDNASSDSTAEILHAFAKRTCAKVISEPRKGKSFGLNRALDAACGDLLIFTDDDVLPCNDWIDVYVEAADRYPQSNVFTGQIRPDWAREPPRWLRHLTDVGRAYGCTPVGRDEGPVSFNQVKGANMMVRASAITDLRYDEEAMNYDGSKLGVGGEDTRFAHALTSDIHPAIYLPQARLLHFIREKQISITSVFRRYVKVGRVRARRSYALNERPKQQKRRIVDLAMKVIRYLLSLNINRAAEEMTKLALNIGEYRETENLEKMSRKTRSTLLNHRS